MTTETEKVMEAWIIRKSGAFYRPNRCGYTVHPEAAGIYTREEAEREATLEASISAHPLSEFRGEDQRKEIARLRAQLSAAEKAAVSARNAVIGECAVRALQARSESGASNAIFAHGWDAGCTWAYNAIRILATKDKKGEVE